MRRVGVLETSQNQPNFLSNLDCTSMTYRTVSSHIMQTGCFTPTAFGLFDSDSNVVIFNGTDEGLRLTASSNNQVLEPWPDALNLVTLDAADTSGSYIGLYTNPTAHLQDQRNSAGQLTGKKLTAPPDISLKDPSGQHLVVNPQTIAFSDGGSWLAAETLGGSFVRINLATLDMTAFATAFGSQGSPALLKSQVAVSDDGRFVAIENTAADSFRIYDLNTCNGIVNNLRPQACQSYEYWPFVNQHAGGLQSIRHVRFLNDGLLSLEVTSSNSSASGIYELAPTDSIGHLTDYIGLGDSYTSGEGAFDYLAGTDTNSSKCHLSSRSYPLLLTRDLFSAAGGHSVACSGAVINDVGSTSHSYRGQMKNGASFGELLKSGALNNIQANFSPGYISQHRFVQHYQPWVATVSIGGNDIGFSDILQTCVEPHISRHTSDQTCYNTYESRQEVIQLIDRTVPHWTALYKQLQAEDPGVQLYAIGYPSIASDTGTCGLNVRLGKEELEFAEALITYLNSSIQQAANAANAPYVDISHALDGHRLCEASGNNVAVNGLTAGNDNGIFGINVLGRESYHPNALGHDLIEQTILQKTANLTAALPAVQTDNSSQGILNVPKSGASVNYLVPDDTLTNSVIHTSDVTITQANGLRDGLQPNTTYAARLDGANGVILAIATSNANGDLSLSAFMPANTVPGGHTVDITGINQTGVPIDISQPVYVTASDGDSDGDGIADSNDSCPYAINSSQDTDNDGADDICDLIIGQLTDTDGGSSPPSADIQPAKQVNDSAESIGTGEPPIVTSNLILEKIKPVTGPPSIPLQLAAAILPVKPGNSKAITASYSKVLGQSVSRKQKPYLASSPHWLNRLQFRLEALSLSVLILFMLIICSV
jgi:hypothetical protein